MLDMRSLTGILISFSIAAFLMFHLSCNTSTTRKDVASSVLMVLKNQEEAWNRGDLEKYMEGYFSSDSLRFASGAKVSYGWNETLSGYQKSYPDLEAMGRLTFSEIDIDVLSDSSAIVFGRWELERKNDHPNGLFTLLFKLKNQDWRIVHDHTSGE